MDRRRAPSFTHLFWGWPLAASSRWQTMSIGPEGTIHLPKTNRRLLVVLVLVLICVLILVLVFVLLLVSCLRANTNASARANAIILIIMLVFVLATANGWHGCMRRIGPLMALPKTRSKGHATRVRSYFRLYIYY